MTTRVQGQAIPGEIAVSRQPALTRAEKSMLRWLLADPEDRVLDANIGFGGCAEYLRRNVQCEVCGVSHDMDAVRAARARLSNCDIVYAASGDIPWMENAFDSVLYNLNGEDSDQLSASLHEIFRVLKPGGQIVLGVDSWPAFLYTASDKMHLMSTVEPRSISRDTVADLLAEENFEKLEWHRTGLKQGVLIGWKHMEMQHVLQHEA